MTALRIWSSAIRGLLRALLPLRLRNELRGRQRLLKRRLAGRKDPRADFNRRFREVAERWPIERFLPTTDLELSPHERAQFRGGVDDWRLLVPRYVSRFGELDGQIYCFGVAHGGTVKSLVEGFRGTGLPLPHMHLFDSFEGLPAEEDGIAVPPVWGEGVFANPQKDFEGKLRQLGVAEDDRTIHPGWFKDSLINGLVDDGTFLPARYVDIDADLYISTVQALDFLLLHRLIRPGTLVGYDDWGDTDLWTAGESRAHKEMAEKHGVRFAQLFSWGEPPLIRKLFLVISTA